MKTQLRTFIHARMMDNNETSNKIDLKRVKNHKNSEQNS